MEGKGQHCAVVVKPVLCVETWGGIRYGFGERRPGRPSPKHEGIISGEIVRMRHLIIDLSADRERGGG
jgi:hypothetical protein